MISKVIDKLFSHRLFAKADTKAIKDVFENADLKLHTFSKGEDILQPSTEEKCMCFVYKGNAGIHSLASGSEVLIRKVSSGEIFGVANLFLTGQAPVSTIVAKSNTEVLFIPASTVKAIIETDSVFAMNYVSFLSEKICFLNKRIACFTSPSAESKLLNYLYSLSSDDGVATLPVSLSSLADMLDMGRASLYRAFDKLETDGIIVRDGKKITFPEKCQF